MSDEQRARELFDSFAASSSRSSRDSIASELFPFFKAPFTGSSIGTHIVDWCLERCVDESATPVSRNASIWFLTELDGNNQNTTSFENRERIFRRLFHTLCQDTMTCAEPMFDLMASLCVDGDEEGMLCQPIIEFVLSEIRVVATCNCAHQSNRSCAVARRVDTVLNLIRLLAETLAACSTDDDIYQALHEFAANPTVHSILQIGSDLLQQNFSTHMDSDFVWHGTRLFLLTAFEPSLRFVIDQLPKVLQLQVVSHRTERLVPLLSAIAQFLNRSGDTLERLQRAVYDKTLPALLELCQTPMEADNTMMVLHALTFFAQKFKVAARKHRTLFDVMLQSCVQLMVEHLKHGSDEQAWMSAKASHNSFDSKIVDDALSTLDEVAKLLGGRRVFSATVELARANMESADWRVRHASLMALNQIGEVVPHAEAADLIAFIVERLQNDSALRVKYAAINCLGQFSQDFDASVWSDNLEQIVTILKEVICDQQQCTRVRAHALNTLARFCECIEPELFQPFNATIMSMLVPLLTDLQEIALRDAVVFNLSSMANRMPNAFVPHFVAVVPPLLAICASDTESTALQSRAFEAVSCALFACIDTQTSIPDNVEVEFVSLLAAQIQRPLSTTDRDLNRLELIGLIVQAFNRLLVCPTLQHATAALPRVVPCFETLIHAASSSIIECQHESDSSDSDQDGEPEGEAGEGPQGEGEGEPETESITGSSNSRVLSISGALLESIWDVIYFVATDRQQLFHSEFASINWCDLILHALPAMSLLVTDDERPSDDCMLSALDTLNAVRQCYANQIRATPTTIRIGCEAAHTSALRVLCLLFNVDQYEPDVIDVPMLSYTVWSAGGQRLSELFEDAAALSLECLPHDTVSQLALTLVNVLAEYDRCELNQSTDDDEPEDRGEEEESPEERRDSFTFHLSDVVGRCSKYLGGGLAFDWLANDTAHFRTHLTQLSESAHSLSVRSAVFILADILNNSPAVNSLPHFGTLMPHFVRACRNNNVEIRQAGVFALGVAATLYSEEQIEPFIQALVDAIEVALNHHSMRAGGNPDCQPCFENTLAAAVKFAFFQCRGPTRRALIRPWLVYEQLFNGMPFTDDDLEARFVWETLAKLLEGIQTGDALYPREDVLGPDDERLVRILELIALSGEAAHCTPELNQRLIAAARSLESPQKAAALAALEPSQREMFE